MGAEQEIRATHEKVVGFVQKLRDFHAPLGDSEQAMLESVLISSPGLLPMAAARIGFGDPSSGSMETGRSP